MITGHTALVHMCFAFATTNNLAFICSLIRELVGKEQASAERSVVGGLTHAKLRCQILRLAREAEARSCARAPTGAPIPPPTPPPATGTVPDVVADLQKKKSAGLLQWKVREGVREKR